MELRIFDHDVDITLITKSDNKTWIGILIDCDIRTIETVCCFTPHQVFHYYAYGCQRMVFGPSLYHQIIKYIKENNILEELL